MKFFDINTADTNLIGDIKASSVPCNKAAEDFLLELEAVMVKYKVVKIDVCLDTFKMMKKDA